MGPIDLLFHLLSFASPALFLAFILAAGGPFLLRRRPALLPWWGQMAVNAVVGLTVLALGLWHFGVDGKMATYAGLAVAMATAQWVGCAGWRA